MAGNETKMQVSDCRPVFALTKAGHFFTALYNISVKKYSASTNFPKTRHNRSGSTISGRLMLAAMPAATAALRQPWCVSFATFA